MSERNSKFRCVVLKHSTMVGVAGALLPIFPARLDPIRDANVFAISHSPSIPTRLIIVASRTVNGAMSTRYLAVPAYPIREKISRLGS